MQESSFMTESLYSSQYKGEVLPSNSTSAFLYNYSNLNYFSKIKLILNSKLSLFIDQKKIEESKSIDKYKINALLHMIFSIYIL